jgi:thiol peroxidase
MAQITLQGNPINTNGTLPAVGDQLTDFTLTKTNLSSASLADYKGQRLILNIFPSVDTGTCASSVRSFNKTAASLDNTKVLCISQDLPFAQGRFCGAEGIENVEMLSGFRNPEFAENYGVKIVDAPMNGLNARAVVVVDENGNVLYTELVPEVVNEPNYEAALATLK